MSITPINSPAFFVTCIACSSEHKPRVTPIIVAIARRNIKAGARAANGIIMLATDHNLLG